jgi:hypothetical protein
MSEKVRRRRLRFKPGDVFQISLPDGRYAYGRVYRDASVGIYRQITDEPDSPPVGSRDFMFNVGMYKDVLITGEAPSWATTPSGLTNRSGRRRTTSRTCCREHLFS